MIEINLLPEDMRRPGATATKTLGILVVAAVLSTSSLAGLAYVYLNLHSAAQSQLEISQGQLNDLQPQQRYAQSLEKEKADYQKRQSTISEIAESRILWSKKIDRLCAVANQDVQSGRHQIWLDTMDMTSGSSRRGGVKLKGSSGGGQVINVSNFHEDLWNDEAFRDGFVGLSDPTTRRAGDESEYQPAESWGFNFEVLLPEKSKKGRRRK